MLQWGAVSIWGTLSWARSSAAEVWTIYMGHSDRPWEQTHLRSLKNRNHVECKEVQWWWNAMNKRTVERWGGRREPDCGGICRPHPLFLRPVWSFWRAKTWVRGKDVYVYTYMWNDSSSWMVETGRRRDGEGSESSGSLPLRGLQHAG